MRSNDEHVIELSKKKLLLITLGACVLVVLGMWLVSLDSTTIQSQHQFSNTMFVHSVGIVSMLFFGICGVYALRKLFDKRPGLVFTDAGIVDNASGVAAGFIPWSDVVGATIFEINKRKMLIVTVKNPAKYVERGGAMRRTVNRANVTMCGSPIAISSIALKISFPELLALFREYHEKYGNV